MNTAFEAAVCGMALIPFATGAMLVASGGRHRGFGRPPSLDSDLRFLGGVWLAYAAFALLFLSDPARYSRLFYVVCLGVVLGGVGRALSWVRAGRPDAVALGALAVELVATPLLASWFWMQPPAD